MPRPRSTSSPYLPGWVAVPAVLAPVVLIGGWTVAAAVQPSGYDPVRDSISALAARGAHDRAVMTVALVLLGICHVGTAAGLRPARTPGRVALAVGGVATVAVASFPQPATGSSGVHVGAATLAFAALAAWPALGADGRAGGLLGPRPAWVASGALALLCVAFAVELGGSRLGLSERVLAGAEALWPLAVVAAALTGYARHPVARIPAGSTGGPS